MIRLMFICHGNICRSPMAEFIFRELLREQGLSADFAVASCATSAEEIWNGVGSPIYPPARAELARHGISYTDRTAVQLRKEDYDRYDLFLCMDERNVLHARRILGGDPQGKLRKLMSYTARPGDVSDPWYTGRFDVAYNDIAEGCQGLLAALRA